MDIEEAIEALKKAYNRYWSILNILLSEDKYNKEVDKYFVYCYQLDCTIKSLKRVFKEELK